MRHSIILLPAILGIISCGDRGKTVVNASFADSLVTHYSPSQTEEVNKNDLIFWQKRMETLPDNFVNGPKLASALLARFHLYGDIRDLLKADSLVKECNKNYGEKEDGVLLKLAGICMLRHRFGEAADDVEKAKKISGPSYAALMTAFDASFEMGQFGEAERILRSAKPDTTYAAYFRRSKYEHYAGNLDNSIHYMLMALTKSEGNKYLKQTALSNAGDLYIHKGKLEDAYQQYLKSIKIDGADFHSIMGIGWIAMAKDKNYPLAQKLFMFVKQHTFSPDVLLKLEQLAEARNDTVAQTEYARKFALQATRPVYGTMYNKYLIGLYTGILHNPSIALQLAEEEVNNRPTPQTFAWYAWTLLQNGQSQKAYRIFQSSVSGQPLEGLELYYMGKLMQYENKNYNAGEFFKAAWNNRYDLSPSEVKELENIR